MKTATVTVNWRSPKDTLLALQSAAAMTVVPDYIICVDNGSPPENVEELRSGMPAATVLIELPDNTGMAANNTGMEYAVAHGVDWTLLLNNDATADPRCLERCLKEASTVERAAIIGPAVRFTDRPELLWLAGGKFSNWFAYTQHAGLKQPVTATPPTGDVGYMPHCCALVSSAAWREIGPVRADFFMYYEDAEWCQRARQLGWRCRHVGEVLCSHAVSASSGRRGSLGLSEDMAYYLARNPMRFALETRQPILRISRVVGLLTVWAGFNALRILQARQATIARAYLQGLRDAFRGRMGKR